MKAEGEKENSVSTLRWDQEFSHREKKISRGMNRQDDATGSGRGL